MSSRDAIPETESPFEAEGMPPTEEPYPGQRAAGEYVGDQLVMRDEPVAVDDYGTTADETAAPEPLAAFVQREEPDPLRDALEEEVEPEDTVVVDRGRDEDWQSDAMELGDRLGSEDAEDDEVGADAGRLVEPVYDEDDEVYGVDSEAEALADAVGLDEGGLSAEEAAMHIEPDR